MGTLLGPCISNDVAMQETLLNLLLRNYLHYNLYDQAEKLRSKAPRFEAHSNQQVTLTRLDDIYPDMLNSLQYS